MTLQISLKGLDKSGAIIPGSPIYFGTVSGEMRSFMERLMFPNLTYTNPTRTLFPKKIKTGFIYTMNITEEQLKEFGYTGHIDINQRTLKTSLVLQNPFSASTPTSSRIIHKQLSLVSMKNTRLKEEKKYFLMIWRRHTKWELGLQVKNSLKNSVFNTQFRF